ncbi:hypothetical protein BGZ99_001882 [Dissophora globulifera]|uniref:Uncharacterized protein n=1 Tax=Dissophora globulifera TaxID=979702 RepID=A0A9P6RQ93_9FUNG|nr:hypothetical protein BGZ99_001882 [Dissophora globulifera]
MATLQALKQRHFKSTAVFDTDHHDDIANVKHAQPPSKVHSAFSSSNTIIRAWSAFVAFLALLCLITYQIHYTLPTPVHDLLNPASGQVQFSEANVRKVIRHLSEDIGYRVVGTAQELETKKYLVNELLQLKEDARIAGMKHQAGQRSASSSSSGSSGSDLALLPNFDMWVQVGDGSHRFDFMSKGKYTLSCLVSCFSLWGQKQMNMGSGK